MADADSSTEKIVKAFVAKDIPPSGTTAFSMWREHCRSLPADAPTVFLDLLGNGSEAEQYVALIALREFRFEAWGQGYGAALEYRVRRPGETEWLIIKPIVHTALPDERDD